MKFNVIFPRFIIVRLLLSSVHLEGSTGAAARDALLLCAKMSARCEQLAQYMLSGTTCPVLATGIFNISTNLIARLERDPLDYMEITIVHLTLRGWNYWKKGPGPCSVILRYWLVRLLAGRTAQYTPSGTSVQDLSFPNCIRITIYIMDQPA